jgi:hypothetical protein
LFDAIIGKISSAAEVAAASFTEAMINQDLVFYSVSYS